MRTAKILSMIASCATLVMLVLAWRSESFYESLRPLFPWAGGVMFIAALNVWRVQRKLRRRHD